MLMFEVKRAIRTSVEPATDIILKWLSTKFIEWFTRIPVKVLRSMRGNITMIAILSEIISYTKNH